MQELDQYGKKAVEQILATVLRRFRESEKVFVIAIDGGSGSGKSTVAAGLATELAAALVPGDDFFAANITADEWDARDPVARAADSIDWRRLRQEVLEPLIAGKPGRWNRFDFVSGERADGTYGFASELIELAPARTIVLEGAYCARPELADLIDFSVLVDVPVEVRHRRLSTREEAAWLQAWHGRWDEAEKHYFSNVRPASSFDLVVTNAPAADRGLAESMRRQDTYS